jgi:hypothetical protein
LLLFTTISVITPAATTAAAGIIIRLFDFGKLPPAILAFSEVNSIAFQGELFLFFKNL